MIYEFKRKKVQDLNFLDVKIILHNSVETDIYYKLTSIHDYLPYMIVHTLIIQKITSPTT